MHPLFYIFLGEFLKPDVAQPASNPVEGDPIVVDSGLFQILCFHGQPLIEPLIDSDLVGRYERPFLAAVGNARVLSLRLLESGERTGQLLALPGGRVDAHVDYEPVPHLPFGVGWELLDRNGQEVLTLLRSGA